MTNTPLAGLLRSMLVQSRRGFDGNPHWTRPDHPLTVDEIPNMPRGRQPPHDRTMWYYLDAHLRLTYGEWLPNSAHPLLRLVPECGSRVHKSHLYKSDQQPYYE